MLFFLFRYIDELRQAGRIPIGNPAFDSDSSAKKNDGQGIGTALQCETMVNVLFLQNIVRADFTLSISLSLLS